MEEGRVARTISLLRNILERDAGGKDYIVIVPKRGYRFVAEVRAADTAKTGLEEKLMLAVLPFANVSPDPKQEFFSDGLTDEMIMQLGRTNPKKLGVIARTSAMRYKRTTKRVDQIGGELGVDYLIEGAVRRDGRRVRITAQLIRVHDQTQVWADSYEQQLQDVLILQSEFASAIDFSEAITALKNAVSLSNRSARCLSSLGYGYGVTGQLELGREILTELEGMSKKRYVGSSDFAIVHAGLGERDQALAWLERACEERDSHLPHLNVDPRLKTLHREPRFEALLKRIGIFLGQGKGCPSSVRDPDEKRSDPCIAVPPIP